MDHENLSEERKHKRFERWEFLLSKLFIHEDMEFKVSQEMIDQLIYEMDCLVLYHADKIPLRHWASNKDYWFGCCELGGYQDLVQRYPLLKYDPVRDLKPGQIMLTGHGDPQHWESTDP